MNLKRLRLKFVLLCTESWTQTACFDDNFVENPVDFDSISGKSHSMIIISADSIQ